MDQAMVLELAKGFARQALTSAGAAAVAGGYITATDWSTVSGAILIAASFIWSYIHHTTTVPVPVIAAK